MKLGNECNFNFGQGSLICSFTSLIKKNTYGTVGKNAVGLLNAAALPYSASLSTGDPKFFQKKLFSILPALAEASRLLL